MEKVDVNSPVKLLSQMIVTFKVDGTPRKTIDYKRLNDVSLRQKNITQLPFMCASACPPGKKTNLLSKENIVRKICEGVKMFEVLRTTSLVTNWSGMGQSLGLWQ